MSDAPTLTAIDPAMVKTMRDLARSFEELGLDPPKLKLADLAQWRRFLFAAGIREGAVPAQVVTIAGIEVERPAE